MDISKPLDCLTLAARDRIEVLEVEWPKLRTIVIEFSSTDQAIEWYQSELYQKVARTDLTQRKLICSSPKDFVKEVLFIV